MPTGRPTKYNDDVQAAAEAYLENYQEAGDAVPTVAGLAYELGVSKQVLYDWSEDERKARFLDVFTRVKLLQERKLLAGGLGGDFNPVIAKMMLSKHGWVEENKQTTFNVEIKGDDADL